MQLHSGSIEAKSEGEGRGSEFVVRLPALSAVAYRRYVNAHQRVEINRDRILPRASKSLGLVTKGCQQGQVDYLTLLMAWQTYLQVNLS